MARQVSWKKADWRMQVAAQSGAPSLVARQKRGSPTFSSANVGQLSSSMAMMRMVRIRAG